MHNENVRISVTNSSSNRFEGVSNICEKPLFTFKRFKSSQHAFLVIKKMHNDKVSPGDSLYIEFKNSHVSGEFFSKVIEVREQTIKVEFPIEVVWRDRRGNRRIPMHDNDVKLVLPNNKEATVKNVSLSGIAFLFEGDDAEEFERWLNDLSGLDECEIVHNGESKTLKNIMIVRKDTLGERVVFGASIGKNQKFSVDSFLQSIINKAELKMGKNKR